MVEITNTTEYDRTLATSHVVPAKGSIHVSAATWATNMQHRFVQLWKKDGTLLSTSGSGAAPAPAPAAVETEPEPTEAAVPEPEGWTREDVLVMSGKEVDELLELHGCDKTGILGKRRERLIEAMYLDI